MRNPWQLGVVVFLGAALATVGIAVPVTPVTATKKKSAKAPVRKTTVKKAGAKAPAAKPTMARSFVAGKGTSARPVPVRPATARNLPPRVGRAVPIAGGPWKEPTFADSALGDVVDGEDLTIRQAAVDALGPYNGSVVVADPKTGRILTIVNQRLALHSGYQPCSTIKLVCALAGLHEGVVERGTLLRLDRRTSIDMTGALAASNNTYFARIGEKLGFERVKHYAQLFGLGEKAGLGIDGEFAGTLPAAPPKFGGVGMMTSFGEGIQLTTLQLASLLGAIANGGTLFHLQYPRTPEEIKNFVPRIKRQLDIVAEIPEIRPGMMAAVDHGTGRRANYDTTEPIFGKTGTCTDRTTPTHLGWFGSFNEVGNSKLVVVVLLTGGKAVNGPVAAQVAGNVYKNLSGQQFFAQGRPVSPKAMTGLNSN